MGVRLNPVKHSNLPGGFTPLGEDIFVIGYLNQSDYSIYWLRKGLHVLLWPLQKRFSFSCAGIFKQSMGARNRVGIGLSYRPARLLYIGWQNSFLGIDFWAPSTFKNTGSDLFFLPPVSTNSNNATFNGLLSLVELYRHPISLVKTYFPLSHWSNE
jgi:hypothetical protein